MARKRAHKPKENADRQGEKPSYGKPPVEHQWKPGESGNPKGCPTRRANIWPLYCRFLALTPKQIRKIDRSKLTLAERSALRLAIAAAKGKRCQADRFARYSLDRDEGRAVEHLIFDNGADLTDDECEALRAMIQGKHDRDTK